MTFFKRFFYHFPVPQKVREADNFYRAGRYKRAHKIYSRILRCRPDNVSALLGIANINFVQKNYPQALRFYQKVLSLDVKNFAALVNMSNTYWEMGDYKLTQKFAAQALDYDSSSAPAWQLLAASQAAQGRLDEALVSYQNSLRIDSSDPWVWNSYSQVLQEKNLYADAAKAAFRAVKLNPREHAHHLNLGYMLYEIKIEQPDFDIAPFLARWDDSARENPSVVYMINALKSNQNTAKADAEYVRQVFDVFAPGFEAVLTGLDYRVPQLLEALLKETYAKIPLFGLRILDAGCGTGFCGKFLKNYAGFRPLWGVDLSAEMLKLAQKKRLYNHLINQDLVDFMRRHPDKFDLIAAADVLTYFGELDSFFSAAQKSLRKSGRILFSLSQNLVNAEDFFLHPSGRFAHSENYLEKTLDKHGFILEKLQKTKLRNEGEQEVHGFVAAVRKA